MDKKTVLLVAITGLGLYLWTSYLGPKLDDTFGFTPPPVVITETEDDKTSDTSVEKTGEARSLDDAKADDTKTEPAKNTEDKTVEKTVEKIEEAVAELLPPEEISTDELVMTIDPQKGIGQIDLLHHTESMDKDSAKVIVGDKEFHSLYLTGSADSWKYGTATVKKSANSITVTRPVIGKNFSVEQEISLAKDYQFVSRFKIKNNGSEPLIIENLGVNVGQMKPIAIGDVGMMAGMDQGVDVFSKKDEDIDTNFFTDILKKSKEQEAAGGKRAYFLETPEGGLQWISVKNRYFAWIVDYEAGFKSCEVSYNKKYVISEAKEQEVDFATAVGYFNTFKVEAGSTYELTLNCFAGPQKYDILKAMDHEKKEIMQLNLFMWTKVGWIGTISEWMLRALVYFHSLLGSYGLAIIMLTIIVKALFWRITNKSTQSMKKMSTLSPKIKELNEKYKDNPQVKQQKIMELYREAGVNPVAGCLPLFLQMPVFIALFNALRGAIELRHSEFLWVADLSQPDTIFEIAGLPVRPLAIAWAASMFLQQKLVPSTADETQKKIMMFMPIVMLFICYGMPSGLTLYWTFSTIMSILQYYLNNKKASAEEAEKAARAATTG